MLVIRLSVFFSFRHGRPSYSPLSGVGLFVMRSSVVALVDVVGSVGVGSRSVKYCVIRFVRL